MTHIHLKLLLFIVLVTISTSGYSQLKNPMKEKQQKEAAARKAAAEKRAAQQRAEAARNRKPAIKSYTEAVNGVSFKMVDIPGGTFQMGSPSSEVDRASDETRHSVTVSSYYIGATEVTQALWQAVMGSNPSSFKGDNFPMETVSWDDCQSFISKLNQQTNRYYRLPTEAEWEYACRAGTTTPFSTGSNLTTEQANYDGNYPYNGNSKGQNREKTTPVGSFAPNGCGLYDMHGNVWEWCSDWYGDYSTTALTNPTGASSGSFRVLRGGSWCDYARYCRSAFRNINAPGYRYCDLGLRLVSPK